MSRTRLSAGRQKGRSGIVLGAELVPQRDLCDGNPVVVDRILEADREPLHAGGLPGPEQGAPEGPPAARLHPNLEHYRTTTGPQNSPSFSMFQ